MVCSIGFGFFCRCRSIPDYIIRRYRQVISVIQEMKLNHPVTIVLPLGCTIILQGARQGAGYFCILSQFQSHRKRNSDSQPVARETTAQIDPPLPPLIPPPPPPALPPPPPPLPTTFNGAPQAPNSSLAPLQTPRLSNSLEAFHWRTLHRYFSQHLELGTRFGRALRSRCPSTRSSHAF